MYVETFNNDAVVLISNFIMCLTSHRQIIFSIGVTLMIRQYHCEIRGKMSKLLINMYILYIEHQCCYTILLVCVRHIYIVHYCSYRSQSLPVIICRLVDLYSGCFFYILTLSVVSLNIYVILFVSSILTDSFSCPLSSCQSR